MKKTICIIIAAVSIVALSLSYQVFAEGGTEITETFYYEGKEITVTTSDEFSYEELQLIADQIAYGDLTPSGGLEGHAINSNLFCVLFGHSIKTATAVEITHNVYTTSPKCVKNTYTVETCERSNCDYYVKTLKSSMRISTCHG